MSVMRSTNISFYTVIFLFAIYLINGIIAIPRNSVVYDEMDYWSYGKRILKLQPQKIYPYDDATISPFHGINALPRATEQLLHPGLLKTDGGFSDIMHGRYVTLLICMLIGFYIYRWSKELFGQTAGSFSLFLFVFCPNLNGNAMLLTSDAYTALFCLITFYYFWKFVKQSNNKYFILFSLSFALSQVIKYSLIHLVLIFAILSLIILLKRKTLFSNWKKNLFRLITLSFITLIVINAAYFFNGTGQKLSAYQFRSSAFQSLQSIPVGSNIPLPLPVPYIEGFDVTYHMLELGAGNVLVSGKNYLFGEFRAKKGFWNYYIVMFLFKTPIPYLAVFLLLAGVYIRRKKNSILTAEFIIFFGLLYYLFVFSFLNNVQIGIRHVLLFYPLLYVLAGRIASVQWKPKFKFVAIIFVIYSLFTFYLFFPNLLSYTNEFIVDKKEAYKIMADTNLDYGQGYFALEKYLEEHSDVMVADTVPKTGKFILGVNEYLDLYGRGKYDWLKNFKPVGHVNYCYLLFDITKEDLEKIPGSSF